MFIFMLLLANVGYIAIGGTRWSFLIVLLSMIHWTKQQSNPREIVPPLQMPGRSRTRTLSIGYFTVNPWLK